MRFREDGHPLPSTLCNLYTLLFVGEPKARQHSRYEFGLNSAVSKTLRTHFRANSLSPCSWWRFVFRDTPCGNTQRIPCCCTRKEFVASMREYPKQELPVLVSGVSSNPTKAQPRQNYITRNAMVQSTPGGISIDSGYHSSFHFVCES